ncbi:hypothetical protein JQ596_32010 [Bradyrhizobium manausense]|uniref:hypothetical protein n=1 Tax=Bradyrhizobium TaxID=374 RepID=UPI001BA696F5|nr:MULTISPECIES: hypothetical protein [Bradyrhizobium]MBR0830164.1 hypothetical protein [Bradyrhizobium manausense]UVO30869.1 hypothetical protein KUF59_09585 [Bradyrhizobium arachidis]
MSEEKARSQAMRFGDLREIIDLLDAAYDAGIHVFMCTTHDRIGEICAHVRLHPERYSKLEFYPCMPYAHKYANAVTEHGMIDALKRFLPTEGAFSALVRGGVSVATRDVEGMARLLIDAEMKMFSGLRTPVIFLQNVVTDLLLGMGVKDAFRIFSDHVRERYNAEPGFITMNLPHLLDVLEEIGIPNPVVCANINKIGFRMCGGIKLYEEEIASRRFRPVAMSVLASGAISPREAIEYVCRQKEIQSIVFGASSKQHIREIKQHIEEFDSRTKNGVAPVTSMHEASVV